MNKFFVVIGTRPEAIKLAPVVMELERRGAETHIIATNQHDVRDTLALFGLKPFIAFDIEQEPDRPLNTLVAQIVTKMDFLLARHSPDCVIVQGDTTSALAGALAAFYRQVPVAHVEAGLRTYDRNQPYPEEINRQIIDRIADYNFPPTYTSDNNLRLELLGETIPEGCPTGNTGIDALRYALGRLGEKRPGSVMPQILMTAHRRENWDKIESICEAAKRIARTFRVTVAFFTHMNPQIQERVKAALQGCKNVMVESPVNYFRMVEFLRHSKLVITDSGGLQEEAATLGIPCFVMRTTTERPEGVEAGAARLVSASAMEISQKVSEAGVDWLFNVPQAARTVYGDGHAAERIVEVLLR